MSEEKSSNFQESRIATIMTHNEKEFIKAIKKGDYKIVETMLEQEDIDPNFISVDISKYKSGNGNYSFNETVVYNPLEKAVMSYNPYVSKEERNGMLQVIKVLLDYGADPMSNNVRSLQYAVNGGLIDIVDLFIDKGGVDITKRIESLGGNLLSNIIFNSKYDRDAALHFLEKKLKKDPQWINTGCAAEIFVRSSNNSENYLILKLLLSYGMNPNVRLDSITALMTAANADSKYEKMNNIVKLLIDDGADLFIKNNSGHTAVDFAGTRRMKDFLKDKMTKVRRRIILEELDAILDFHPKDLKIFKDLL